MENTIMQDNDTINLRELFQTMARRKKLILFITLLFVALAGLYLYTAKPIYQVKAMIEIGKLEANTKDETSLDNVSDVKRKLEYIYAVKSKKKRDFPRVKAIVVNKQAKGVFTVVAEGHTNKEAVSLIEDIVKKIEKEYQEKIDTYINTKKDLISLTKKDIEIAKKNLDATEEALDDYNQKIMNITAKDAALAGIYTIQMSQNQTRAQDLQSRISALKAKIYNLQLTITPLRIIKTKIIGNIEVMDKPVKPKKALIVIVAFITGLMFSIFLVFFLEFLRGIKEERE